jgi:2-dehydropantoate 2-reductase
MKGAFAHVAVMGAGAVGGYFGAMLARAGAQVTLIGRQALVDAVARDALVLDSARFPARLSVAATADPAGVAGAGLVLFCVKSSDTDGAAAAMAPHLAPGAVVLSLQNGVDNVERLRARMGNPVVPAVVYVSAEIPAPTSRRSRRRLSRRRSRCASPATSSASCGRSCCSTALTTPSRRWAGHGTVP